MFGTRLCVLLKGLMLAKAVVALLSKEHTACDSLQEECPDLNLTQNLKPIRNHSDNVTVKNEVDKIPLANMSMISESIESIPSEPTSPRAFVEFYNGFLNEKDISVTFRWNQPEFTNEMIQGYTVQCWFIENLKKIQICDDESVSATIFESTVHNLKPNTTYFFQVRAHTTVGAGPYTDLMNVSATHENPIPQLLFSSDNGVQLWDLDSKIMVNLVETQNVFIHNVVYSIAEHKIYWFAGPTHEIMENLMTQEMNKTNIINITRVEITAHNLCIDWVAKNLYWTELEEYRFYNLIKFDLTMWQNGIIKYDKISMKTEATIVTGLTVQPSMGCLYWMERRPLDNQDILIKSDLDGENKQHFIETEHMKICPYGYLGGGYLRATFIDITNTEGPLIYQIQEYYNKHELYVADIRLSRCKLILTLENGISIRSLTVDMTNVYFKASEHFTRNNNIYIFKKKYASLDNEKKILEHVQIVKNVSTDNSIHNIMAFGKSLQPYPRTECLTPDKNNYYFKIINITANSIVLKFPEPIHKRGCKKYNLPTTIYIINVSHCLDNSLDKFVQFNKQTHERYYEIQNLTPLTEYKLKLALSNFYFNQLSMDPMFGSDVTLRTNPDKLNVPENVTVQPLTPTIAAVYWMPPKKLNCVTVTYKVYWESLSSLNSMRPINMLLINKPERNIDSKFFTIIQPMLPGYKYSVYVRVHPVNFSDLFINSLMKTVSMYSEPNNITLSGISLNGINISWIPSVNLTINYILEYRNVQMQEWQIANSFEINNETVMYYLKNLLPGTLYKFRLILTYPEYENYTWPSDGRFTFQTLDDVSSTSGILATPYYLSLTLSLVAVVTVICVCIYFYLYRQHKKGDEHDMLRVMTNMELAIIHEIPIGEVQFNTLYSPTLSEYNPDEFVLTKIKHEQITLAKLLGSGAFGMVFQGKVKDLEGPGIETPAAIKMLRKNASSQEKKKFLQEARLMNRFRHKHVLRLLAVCVNEASPLLVLELMEIGDLLKYLRESRKLQPSDSHALRLQDLLTMCEDVARGCFYLEKLRFVHRDLACRNCLVSARDRENRVVKIGDFGLARDIYKEDYYRKEGEGLLPIRWMAPESLVFGIFTSLSDVWSFGVIIWEITSLGEQPYTAKSNSEVINYVRTGGMLSKPLNCPSTLHQLMLRCWSAANARPNFKLCLENIIALRKGLEDAQLNPVDDI